MIVLNLAHFMKKYLLLIVLVVVAIRFLKGPDKPQVARGAQPAAHAAILELKQEGVRSYWTTASK